MAYLHINNLYRQQDILLFKEVFALEKIHGTSAHISYSDTILKFFSGGESHEKFCKLFNQEFLLEKFKEIGQSNIIVFGEAYGGKCQGMSGTYGKDLKFIVFDVKIGDCWLDVPKAEAITKTLGLEFVHYVKVSTDLKDLDVQRDAPSIQAVRNGIVEPKEREGVVLRPIIELTKNNGERVICKHKGEKFSETKTPRKVVDPALLEVIIKAEVIGQEYVTNNRLEHILQKIEPFSFNGEIPVFDISQTGTVIKSMLEDIKREATGEIVWNKEVEKVIGKNAALIFKEYLVKNLQMIPLGISGPIN